MKNISASIRAKLLNYARKDQISFQRVLTLYIQEGLLHRVVMSKYGDDITLKGGLMFYQLQGMAARPTKDIEDGLTFDLSSIQTGPIKGQTDHGGIRGYITGYLGKARTQLQLDMGFGDVVTGGPIRRPYRTILGNRSFSIQTYTDETIAAEKLEAFISLGTMNSRFKDIYDLYELLVIRNLPKGIVVDAAVNTFLNRKTTTPESPESLTDAYWESQDFEKNWIRYLKRIDATSPDYITLRDSLLVLLRSIYDSVKDCLEFNDPSQ